VSVYGVLLTGCRDTAELESSTAPLRDCCDQVVVVHQGTVRSRSNAEGADASRLDYLLAAMRRIPADASIIAFADDRGTDTEDLDAVGKMMEKLDEDTAAVVRAVPVTDALKRVDQAEVVGGLDRQGLFFAETPQVLRRASFEEAIARGAGELVDDPAALLVRAGMRVELLEGVRAAGTPMGTGEAGESGDVDQPRS
jgi:2-C-methyl-D-erythritol 4-phosphate cytidylyltransferase